MSLRAGQLRRRVVFQSRAVTQDTLGGQSTTWTTLATVFAEILPLSGRELEVAQAMHAETSHQITVRYQAIFANPTAVAAYRITYNGRVFNITGSVNQEQRNRIVVIFASEGLNQG